MENTFINSKMIPGHRYDQRFTTISEGASYPVGFLTLDEVVERIVTAWKNYKNRG